MNNSVSLSFWRRFFGHLHTVNKHRFLVMRLCFKAGLYHQGLTHDLSKYSPCEFWPGVKYFQGDKSPIVAQRQALGYSFGWLHHKGRNPHHWEFWTDRNPGTEGLIVREMPKKYIKEMTCDRISACMVYEKDKYTSASPLNFHLRSSERAFIPVQTEQLLRHYLTLVAENDLNIALKMIKEDK
jgi:hypothetical protein